VEVFGMDSMKGGGGISSFTFGLMTTTRFFIYLILIASLLEDRDDEVVHIYVFI
jgi:hypothetical protein